MANPEEIRSDVDKTIGIITDVVETAQAGNKLALALKIAAVIPELLINGTAFKEATTQEKTDYALEGFDALVGNEATAIVKSIGPIGADGVEAFTDVLKDTLRKVFEKKFAEVE